MADDLRKMAHALLVWAEGYTRNLTRDEKIAHIETALRAVQREAIEAAARTPCIQASPGIFEAQDDWSLGYAQACNDSATAIRAPPPPTTDGKGGAG